MAAPKPAAVAAAWLVCDPRRARMALGATFALVVAVRVLFLYSYPLNNAGMDVLNYYRMMTEFHSSLVHAPGYPFVFGLFLRSPAAQQFITDQAARFHSILMVTQHALDLLALAGWCALCLRLFGLCVAVVATLALGTNVFGMSFTSTTFPEWFQSATLIVSLIALERYTRAETLRGRTIWLTVSALLFTLCLVVKFNALPFIVLHLIAVAFVTLRSRHVRELLPVGAAVAASGLALVGFIAGFHYPSTGSYHLTRDRSWVLMARLATIGPLSADDGVATKRWLALNRLLPPDYHLAGPALFRHEQFADVDRRRYAGACARVVAMSEAELDRLLASHPDHAGFEQRISSIPISVYCGLGLSEDLGVAVFREFVLAHPFAYARSVLRLTLKDYLALSRVPMLPFLRPGTALGPGEPSSYAFRTEFSGAGLSQIVTLRLNPKMRGYWPAYWWNAGDVRVWVVGSQVLDALDRLQRRDRLIAVLVTLGGLAALGRIVRRRRWGRAETCALLAFLSIPGFIVFSNTVLYFRDKELRLVLPIVCVAAAIGFCWTSQALLGTVQGLRLRRHAVPPAGG